MEYINYRLICLIVGLSVSVISQVVELEEACEYISLSGAVYHSSSNGLYARNRSIHCNGKPVWEDTSARHFVYYLLDGYDGWMASSTSCYHWGNFMMKAKSDAPFPYAVKETWDEYSPEEAMWKASHTLRFDCASSGSVLKSTPRVLVPTGRTDIKPPAGGQLCQCINGDLDSKCCSSPFGIHGTHRFVIMIVSMTTVITALLVLAVVLVLRRHRTQASAEATASPPKSLFKYKPLNETISTNCA